MKKCQFFLTFWTSSWPILPKKKSWKNGHFWSKTMGYPLKKNVNLSTFWTSSFYSLERRFFVLEYRKRHFPGLYCLKKSWKSGHFRSKTMGYPLGKNVKFSTFLISFCYSLERRYFYSRISEKRFTWAILPKKNWKNGHFWTKTMG